MITKYPIYSQLSNSSFYRFLFAFVICCLNLDPDKGHTFTLVEIPPRSRLIYRFPQIIFSLQLFCWRNQVVYPEVFPWVWILQAMNQWNHLVCFFVPIFFGKLTAISKSLIKCFFVFYFLQDYFSGGVKCCAIAIITHYFSHCSILPIESIFRLAPQSFWQYPSCLCHWASDTGQLSNQAQESASNFTNNS